MRFFLRAGKVFLSIGVVLFFFFLFSEISYRIIKVAGNLINKTYAVKEQEWRVYDELLGWANKPNLDTTGTYDGIKMHITFNSQGFRGKKEYPHYNPDRIVVLGDSFTFGFGESDYDTYPACLERELKKAFNDPEVVNMGCAAYGLDQEYLWFKRDGARLKSPVLIWGILDINFSRSSLSRWIQGENKPRFKLTSSGLRLTNVPVPKMNKVGSLRVSKNDISYILFNLKGSYFLSFLRDRLYRLNLMFVKYMPESSESFLLGKEIIMEMQQLCKSNNIRLIIVIFPKRDWEQHLQPIYFSMKNLVKELNIENIDMVEVLNENGSWDGLYNSSGHLSARGNNLTAKATYNYLERACK